ncbi:hypothetical protein EN781_00030 [Mesorhizobium sp. M4A.F.Ca.ET.090.04.2.1]|uniref:hypothetical protein n=1 Tax=Mesorhizobium sp. M4A.F.Ca.ET.090.04.2.1 TaxID=2496663 RepID=UPI000FCC02D8|nr:hypothetical protein [Mesorhizobium sp. M4A.F.Ca.ET.090.04.2.1]RVC47559.1 hypothetical protein EN781_00030 [Mesorhizobium sp. M4A.F.Ca.ET.090.04.2.1]
MKRVWVIAAALIVLCLAMIWRLTPAHAQSSCAPLQAMLDRLAKAYHEFIVIRGTTGDQQMLFTLSQAGTYSVIVSDGRTACVVLVGEKAELDNGI